MATFPYARSGNVNCALSRQLASLKEAGCSAIMIDRSNGLHPRDLRRRAALLGSLQPGDTVMAYSLECLAVSGGDLVRTIADIRSRKAVLETTGPDFSNSFCNDTIDAITSAFVSLGRSVSGSEHSGPRPVGRSAILTPADWPQVEMDCDAMGTTKAAEFHNVSRSALYSFIARMRRETTVPSVIPARGR